MQKPASRDESVKVSFALIRPGFIRPGKDVKTPFQISSVLYIPPSMNRSVK
jgi:hypothetical protein